MLDAMGTLLRELGDRLWPFPWRESADVVLMSFIVYQVYIRIRGTRAIRILAGIIFLGLGYLAAQSAGLFLTSWVLGGIWAAALILVIVIFQAEIRQMLEQVNPKEPLRTLLRWGRQARLPEETLATMARTAFSLAARRWGALFVFERHDVVEPLLKSPGVLMDAEVTPELVETLFTSPAPLHDGALYVRRGRAYRAGCILPLSDNQRLAQFHGTRHRAALGITEQSDALAVVVSEERGKVSVIEKGIMTHIDTPADLLIWLTDRISAREEPAMRRWSPWALIAGNWRPKLATVVGVSLLFILLTGHQNAEVGVSIPVVYLNVPKELTIDGRHVQEVYVRVRGSREMLNFLDPNQMQVAIDLEKAHEGSQRYSIADEDIKLPPGLKLAGVNPSMIRLRLVKKPPEPKKKG
ncbi:MAG: diadenylate cyclase [Candidatus Methylomirabilales bacterium]